MTKIEQVFNAAQINIDNNQPLTLSGVDVDDVNRKWVLHFQLDHLITSDYYNEIYTKLNTYFSDRKVSIKLRLHLNQPLLANQEHARVLGHLHFLFSKDNNLQEIFKYVNVGILDNKIILSKFYSLIISLLCFFLFY